MKLTKNNLKQLIKEQLKTKTKMPPFVLKDINERLSPYGYQIILGASGYELSFSMQWGGEKERGPWEAPEEKRHAPSVDPFGRPGPGPASLSESSLKQLIREEYGLMQEVDVDPMALLTMMCSALGKAMLQQLAFDIIDNPKDIANILAKGPGAQIEKATGMSLNEVVNAIMGAQIPGLGVTIEMALDQAEGMMGAMIKPTLIEMVPAALDMSCKTVSDVDFP
jgi:hypothetical protein